jgi:predicted glycogen debranching enzyme
MPCGRAKDGRSSRGSKSAALNAASGEGGDFLQFGRDICGDLQAAESREWLVTSGTGGFASGTVAGSATRRYHGLLFAALRPPLGRTQLVAAVDETAHYRDAEFKLATHHWAGGAIDPQGYSLMEGFRLEAGVPVWTYALADARIERHVWMRQGEDTTYVQYTYVRGSGLVALEIKVLVNYRDFHGSTRAGNWTMHIDPAPNGARVLAYDGATPFYLLSAGAACQPQHTWYHSCFFARERERGLDDNEDELFAATFRATLEPGAELTLVFTTREDAALDGAAMRQEQAASATGLRKAPTARPQSGLANAPAWASRLLLAAAQFIVRRPLPDEPNGCSVIAGYHWFGDWGRDTMIALPGLTLATGRENIARNILLALARYADGGMLPNNFPDSGGRPEYNTIDATLWFFEAVRQYIAATDDNDTLAALYPTLAAMIDAHVNGTRYNIHVDPADGLLAGGGAGVQLTWMDAKVGDWVVTPRAGKPVEVNALWINALTTMAQFARRLKKPFVGYEKLAAKAAKNFQKFWNPQRNCCYDVLDAPGGGGDAALRPNQIFAASLPVSPLTAQQQKAVVDCCAKYLVTARGLRSLAPGEAGYSGRYEGGPRERDAAYHQGTVWGWLLGSFALAHHRVYGDRATALAYLEPLGTSLSEYGLGTVGEIFDGDAPHTPRGCIAQAWSVAELLRAADELCRPADN